MDDYLDLQLLKLCMEHLLPRLSGRHSKAGRVARELNPSGVGESVKLRSDRRFRTDGRALGRLVG